MRLSHYVFIAFLMMSCSSSENGSNSSTPGSPVMATSFCQLVSVIQPNEAKYSELPFALRDFYDRCDEIVWEKAERFVGIGSVFRCTLKWDESDSGGLAILDSSINSVFGVDGPTLRSQANLDGFDQGSQKWRVAFLYGDETTANILYTQDSVWPFLASDIVDLEELSWRFDLQWTNASLCSEGATWDKGEDSIRVNNVTKCHGGGRYTRDNYVFSLGGILLEFSQEEVSGQVLCP